MKKDYREICLSIKWQERIIRLNNNLRVGLNSKSQCSIRRVKFLKIQGIRPITEVGEARSMTSKLIRLEICLTRVTFQKPKTLDPLYNLNLL